MPIAVEKTKDDAKGFAFTVSVQEGRGESRHEVTLARSDFERLARAGETPEAFLRRCFEFLLAREPKESILSRFDVTVIGRYFSEFEREIRA